MFVVNLKKSFKVIVKPEKIEQNKPDKQMYYRGGAWIPVEPIQYSSYFSFLFYTPFPPFFFFSFFFFDLKVWYLGDVKCWFSIKK